jgi:Uma2 family endonuclease
MRASKGGSKTVEDWLALPHDVDVELDSRVYRPDVEGWRRERAAEPFKDRPVTARPDWICEIVSDSNRTTDTVTKLRRYHQAGVVHHWIIDQIDGTLTVHRHTSDGYLVALRALRGERVRAEPFEAIEIQVSVLLGADEE